MPILFDYSTIRTPIDTLNVLGAGGLKEGSIVELYGPQQSGKSATAYQIASMFLEDNPEGRVTILDSENSIDYIRITKVFGIDPLRIDSADATTLEKGFSKIFDICKSVSSGLSTGVPTDEDIINSWISTRKYNKLCKDYDIDPDLNKSTIVSQLLKAGAIITAVPTPHLVIWDTIAVSVAGKDYDNMMGRKENEEIGMWSGGMLLRPRIIKHMLAGAMGAMSGKPVTVILLNQVMTTNIGGYGGPGVGSAGGNSLKHNCHYRIFFDRKKTYYDESKGMNVGSSIKVKIEKSKFCPTTQDIWLYVDDTLGGKIIPQDEAANTCLSIGLIQRQRGWFRFMDGDDSSYHWSDIENNESMRQRCIAMLAHHFRSTYSTLDWLYKELGNPLGALNEEEQEQLVQPSVDTSEPIAEVSSNNEESENPEGTTSPAAEYGNPYV